MLPLDRIALNKMTNIELPSNETMIQNVTLSHNYVNISIVSFQGLCWINKRNTFIT